MIANGEAPDAVKNHPAMKRIDLKKKSGAINYELMPPASTTGIPMTCQIEDKQ